MLENPCSSDEGRWVLAYNAWGDLTSAADRDNGVTTHTYDAGGRLVRLTVPAGGGFGVVHPFSYDALGRPAQRGTLATLTYRYVGASPVSSATVPSAGSVTYGLLDADGSRLALHTGGTTAWTSFDLHGNLVGATASGSGTIVSALRYDAYGATLDSYTAGSGATETPWRYQGRLDLSPDADEPLYDYGARRYRPSLGAFTGDPVFDLVPLARTAWPGRRQDYRPSASTGSVAAVGRAWRPPRITR